VAEQDDNKEEELDLPPPSLCEQKLLRYFESNKNTTRNQKHHLKGNAIPAGYSHAHMLITLRASCLQCIVIGPVSGCVAVFVGLLPR